VGIYLTVRIGTAEIKNGRREKKNRKINTRWFKYDRDCLCVNKSQFVPVIFEQPCNRRNKPRVVKKKK
jgi:hypothetical protein